MPAYIIAVRKAVHDKDAMRTYSKLAAEAAHVVPERKVLAAYGTCETLEGGPATGVVLLEFPDMEHARTWYGSEQYQLAKEQRLKGADYDFILFEGL